jgi:hypothetical protein
MAATIRAAVVAALALMLCVSGGVPGVAADEAAPKIHAVAFALFGDENVFAREAEKAAAIVRKQLGATDVVVRANTRGKREAMIADLKRVLGEVGARMNADKDILFLLVTSHGTPAGAFVKAGATTEILSPSDLEELLSRSGIKRRIVVVSACYSGVFADALANPATLVITASDAHHPSFGCRNGNDWTYFGRAFFADALERTNDLRSAFATATSLIKKREAAMHLVHSNPQMAGGELVLAGLGQGQVSKEVMSVAAAAPPARCVVKVEPLPDLATCKVFNGYSGGERVGYFRLADRKVKKHRIGVAAAGACPGDFVKGRQIAANKIETGNSVYTLGPDCRSAIKTTQ